MFLLLFFLTFWVVTSGKALWKKISWVVLDLLLSLIWLPMLIIMSIFTIIKSIKTNFPKKDLEVQ